MARALKVYRTPIGFHDAYVAATSQKAALEAWGSTANLFARGAAELVTDESLAREPLAQPGTVIRRPRGTTAEHLAALDERQPPGRRRPMSPAPENEDGPRRRARPVSAPAAAPKPRAKPRPRPSRTALDDAESALERAQAERDEAIADIRRREGALQQERRALEKFSEEKIAELEHRAGDARERYQAAISKWRA